MEATQRKPGMRAYRGHRISLHKSPTPKEAATARQVSDLLLRLFKFSNPNQGDGRPATILGILDRGTIPIETELRGQPKVQAELFGALSHVYEAMRIYHESKTLAEKSLALPHVDGREGELQKSGGPA
jgi:hypothetical protein